MPHLARPTSSIRGNRSTGVQRFVAWPQQIAVSLRLTDQATSIDRERVSTTRVRGWDHESIRTRMIDPSAHADGADLMTRHSTVYCLALTVPSRAGARLVDRIAVKDSSRGRVQRRSRITHQEESLTLKGSNKQCDPFRVGMNACPTVRGRDERLLSRSLSGC